MAFYRISQNLAEHTGRFLGGLLLSCRQSYKISRLKGKGLRYCVLPIRQELRNTADQLSLVVQAEPVRLISGLNLHVGAHLIYHFSGSAKAAEYNCLHVLSLKRPEAAALHAVRGVRQRQINPQIRLVRSVPLHCVMEGNPLKGRFGSRMIRAVFCKNRRKHILQYRKYILLGGKCHLHIKLIKLSRRTVRPGVLIPEAGRNLEITVKAGGHQKLLKLLRSLGKRIKFPRMISGGHQIVSCTLGGGAGENGGGNLQEAMLRHAFSQLRNYIATQNNAILDCRIAQIQIAVAQTCIFVRLLGTVDLKGKLVVAAFSQYLNGLRHYLDIPRRQVGVFAGALPHHACD